MARTGRSSSMPSDNRPRNSDDGKFFNAFAQPDDKEKEKNKSEKQGATKRKLEEEETYESSDDNNDSTKAKEPKTPSPLADKTKRRKVATDNVEDGVVKKCLSDFVEKEGEKYLRKLDSVANSSESEHSFEELAKSGAKLSEHAWKIKKLGERFISLSEDILNKYKNRFNNPSSSNS